MSKNKHRGSDLRDFLKEQGVLGEVEARALKQSMSLQISRLLAEKSVTKAEMAARMKTSRAAVDRLLDASNVSVTLNTLGKAARALGRKVKTFTAEPLARKAEDGWPLRYLPKRSPYNPATLFVGDDVRSL